MSRRAIPFEESYPPYPDDPPALRRASDHVVRDFLDTFRCSDYYTGERLSEWLQVQLQLGNRSHVAGILYVFVYRHLQARAAAASERLGVGAGVRVRHLTRGTR